MVNETRKIIDIIMDLANEHQLSACFNYIKEFGDVNGRNENTKVLINSFLETFPGLSDDFLYQIYISSNFFCWAIYITDKILDESTTNLNKEALMLSYILREKSIKILCDIFPNENKIWYYFDKYYKEYTGAVIHEAKNHFNKICNYSTEEMEMICNGKTALAKFIPAAFAVKSGKEELITSIESSIQFFYTALNIYDDVCDWKKDFNEGQYTYLLTRVIVENNLEGKLKDIDVQDLSMMDNQHF